MSDEDDINGYDLLNEEIVTPAHQGHGVPANDRHRASGATLRSAPGREATPGAADDVDLHGLRPRPRGKLNRPRPPPQRPGLRRVPVGWGAQHRQKAAQSVPANGEGSRGSGPTMRGRFRVLPLRASRRSP
jgi:hypothetical protein